MMLYYITYVDICYIISKCLSSSDIILCLKLKYMYS